MTEGADDTKSRGKAIRRTDAERSALARLDADAVASSREFWHAHAYADFAHLIDAEPVVSSGPLLGLEAFAFWVGPKAAAKRVWDYLTASRVFRAVRTGVVLAASAVRGPVETVTAAAERDATTLGERLKAGELDVPTWQASMEKLVKTVHGATGLVGAGGHRTATDADRKAVETRVQAQFAFLEAFAVEVESGLPLDNTIPARCAMYATAAVGTYERSKRVGDLAAGWSFERRLLHSVVPCSECVQYSERGWQPALVLPDVGEECTCTSRCKCTFERSQTDPRVKGNAMATTALEYLLSRPLLCTPEAAYAAASVVFREGSPLALATRKGTPMDADGKMEKRDGVAVLKVEGPIYRHANLFTDVCGGTTTEALARDLRSAVEDQSVRAILLDVDSPGGEAAGIAELAGQVRAANGVKPVCAYVGDSACSAAYWLASAAGEVVCSETASLGSIGVVMGLKVHADKAGVKSYEFVSSKSPLKRPDPETEAGKAAILERCDALCDVFIAHVAGFRGTTAEKVEADFGKGGVLTGKAAVDAGMADAVGTFESTLARLSKGETLPARPKARAKPATTRTKGTSMNFASIVAAFFKSNPEAAAAALADADREAAGPDAIANNRQALDDSGILARLAPNAENRPPMKTEDQIRAEIKAEHDAANAKAMAAFYGEQASAWFDGMVAAGKALPATKARTCALYVDAATADRTAGPITFEAVKGSPETMTRLSFLTSTLAAAPDNGKTVETVTDTNGAVNERLSGLKVLPESAGGDRSAKSADDILSLLSATPAGRAELARRAAAAK